MKKINSRISANSAQAISQLACAGVGLAVVPEFVARPLAEAGDLEYVLPDWTTDPINVFAVWPSNAPRDGMIKHLVNFLKAK